MLNMVGMRKEKSRCNSPDISPEGVWKVKALVSILTSCLNGGAGEIVPLVMLLTEWVYPVLLIEKVHNSMVSIFMFVI